MVSRSCDGIGRGGGQGSREASVYQIGTVETGNPECGVSAAEPRHIGVQGRGGRQRPLSSLSR